MFPHGFTLQVTRPAGEDRFGKKLAAPAPHSIEGCAVAPAGSTELVNGQATVLEQDTVYAPFDADVLAKDEVTIPAGQAVAAGKYQVEGRPARWRSPFTGHEFGTVIRLTGADG